MSYITGYKTRNTKFLSLFFLFIILGFAIFPSIVSATTPGDISVKEAHLIIPKIGVDAVIKDMGITLDGVMAVPNNTVDVGWFSLGTRPGQTGSAVIGAHNELNSKLGVFAHLSELKVGDTLSVVDVDGISISFIVRKIHTYSATDTNSGIFQSTNGVHLNLVTCSGAWNPSTKTHTTRLVVFTDMIETVNKS
jgi:LPXTG-site transpeptidase (sortase) family protein